MAVDDLAFNATHLEIIAQTQSSFRMQPHNPVPRHWISPALITISPRLSLYFLCFLYSHAHNRQDAACYHTDSRPLSESRLSWDSKTNNLDRSSKHYWLSWHWPLLSCDVGPDSTLKEEGYWLPTILLGLVGYLPWRGSYLLRLRRALKGTKTRTSTTRIEFTVLRT